MRTFSKLMIKDAKFKLKKGKRAFIHIAVMKLFNQGCNYDS